jgi:hypothetical protein
MKNVVCIMSHILSSWINTVPDAIVSRCSADIKHADELRIAAISAQSKGLHFLLNELNVIKNLQTWIDMLILIASNDQSRVIATVQKQRIDTYVEDRYSDIWLYELVSLFSNSTRRDGQKTINRALNRELTAFRMAGIELDPEGKQKLKSTLYSIRDLEQLQIKAIDVAINDGSNKSVENTTDVYKQHYLSFVSKIQPKPLLNLITLRHSLAQLLDFSSYAAMVQVNTLAKQPDAVAHVLTQITPDFDYSFSDEARALLVLNKGKPLQAWDLGVLENSLATHYAPLVPPIFSESSVITLTLKLTEDLGISLKPGTNSWHASVKHWSCNYGDIYIQQTLDVQTWKCIPITHRLTTFGADMEILTSVRPHILLRGPNAPFTTDSLESFLIQWGCSLRYLLIGSGMAGLLNAEAEAEDLTGYILIEMMWEERNMHNLELASNSKKIQDKAPVVNKVPIEKLRYLKRRRDLLIGLQSKIELLHCKFDLVIHSNMALLKSLSNCNEQTGISELLALQMRLWRDNMGCKNQSKFSVVPPPQLEATCWKELYDTPGLRYSEIWGKLLAADVYQNCIRNGNSKLYADCLLRFGAIAQTDRIIYKLIGRHPNYDAYFDLRVHMLRSYYDRDDDETSEQVDSSKLMLMKISK